MDKTEVMRVFVAKMDELKAAKKTIDDELANLSSAYESLFGRAAEPDSNGNGKHRVKRDHEAIAKTLSYLSERSTVTVKSLARQFRITRTAANVRLRRAVSQGKAERVGRGVYRAKGGV